MEVLGLGGGCHWCTEAVFQALRGVRTVEQGWIASDAPDDVLSEAVRLSFDPNAIPLATLIDVHVRTHAAGSDHAMRGKYRSAVYTTSEEQRAEAEKGLVLATRSLGRSLVTKALPLRRFEPSPARYQGYHTKRPDAPFCRTHIDPKLALIRARYAEVR